MSTFHEISVSSNRQLHRIHYNYALCVGSQVFACSEGAEVSAVRGDPKAISSDEYLCKFRGCCTRFNVVKPVLWDYSSPICCYTLHVAHGDVVPVLVCGRVQRSGCAMRSKEKDVKKMQPKGG